MSTLGLKTTVSSQEAEALKEMIFNRARARAQALVDEAQDSYAKNMQAEVMDMARDSFVSSKNPFSEQKNVVDTEKSTEIGFAKRQVNEIKKQIDIKNNLAVNDLKNKEVELVMEATRENLSKKPSFIGALNFLNSQASIALVKNKGQGFEALA